MKIKTTYNINDLEDVIYNMNNRIIYGAYITTIYGYSINSTDCMIYNLDSLVCK